MLPALVIGVGLATAVVGGYLVRTVKPDPVGVQHEFICSVPGNVLLFSGLAVAAAGVLLWFRASRYRKGRLVVAILVVCAFLAGVLLGRLSQRRDLARARKAHLDSKHCHR